MKKLPFACFLSGFIAFGMGCREHAADEAEPADPVTSNAKCMEISQLLRGGVDPIAFLDRLDLSFERDGKKDVWLNSVDFVGDDIRLRGRGENIQAINNFVDSLCKAGVVVLKEAKWKTRRDIVIFEISLTLKAMPAAEIEKLPAEKTWERFKNRFEGKGYSRRQLCNMAYELAGKAFGNSRFIRELRSIHHDGYLGHGYLIHGSHISFRRAQWEDITAFVDSIKKERPEMFLSIVEIRAEYKVEKEIEKLAGFHALFEISTVELNKKLPVATPAEN